MISTSFQINFNGSQTYWIINRSHFYRFQIEQRLSNGQILIQPHLDPIFTFVQVTRISEYFQGQNILWMIKSKVCPCSCDSGEIIAAPDGFTFALMAQQGNVLNQMRMNWMSCIQVACIINLFACISFANKIWCAKRIRNYRICDIGSRSPRRAVT